MHANVDLLDRYQYDCKHNGNRFRSKFLLFNRTLQSRTIFFTTGTITTKYVVNVNCKAYTIFVYLGTSTFSFANTIATGSTIRKEISCIFVVCSDTNGEIACVSIY